MLCINVFYCRIMRLPLPSLGPRSVHVVTSLHGNRCLVGRVPVDMQISRYLDIYISSSSLTSGKLGDNKSLCVQTPTAQTRTHRSGHHFNYQVGRLPSQMCPSRPRWSVCLLSLHGTGDTDFIVRYQTVSLSIISPSGPLNVECTVTVWCLHCLCPGPAASAVAPKC